MGGVHCAVSTSAFSLLKCALPPVQTWSAPRFPGNPGARVEALALDRDLAASLSRETIASFLRIQLHSITCTYSVLRNRRTYFDCS